MPDLIATAGDTFGFADWNLGMGMVGTFTTFIFLSILVAGGGGFLFYLWWNKKVFSQKIKVFSMMGKQPMLKYEDRAKILPVGYAGDRLFLMKKQKRALPPPTIQMGFKEWWYWEREDGELINIGMENLDEIQRKLGIHFVDTDMRMQRLGIEKNLQFRLQNQSWWDKYGGAVANGVFYVLVTLMLIVLFMQWRKVAEAVVGAVESTSLCNQPTQPSQTGGGGGASGVIPALMMIGLTKWRIWRLNKNEPTLNTP